MTSSLVLVRTSVRLTQTHHAMVSPVPSPLSVGLSPADPASAPPAAKIRYSASGATRSVTFLAGFGFTG